LAQVIKTPATVPCAPANFLSMEVFRGCQAACAQCQQSGDVPLSPPCKPRFCSWAEEEVDGGMDGGIGLDYGDLGRWPVTGTGVSALRSDAHRLMEPGGLVPIRAPGPSSPSRPKPWLTDVYALDEAPFGRGSYGEVIGATHRRTGARRAVKIVAKAGLRRYVKDVSGFVRREVDILRRLDHPNIVRLYEAFEDEAHICLVLEICAGGDLLERVTVARDRMPEHTAALLMTQMLAAVQHLFLRGVVHRDIKPENYLFTRRETEREPNPPIKLIDFGLSRQLDLAAGTRMTPKIGTTEYMAPEAFAGRIKPAMADRADIWSLGVVLHVIFIGHFPSPRLAELSTEEYLAMPCWRQISAQGRDFLAQMIRYEPEHRPTVSRALRHPWLASVATASPHAARWARGLPQVLSAYAQSPELRRVALVAAARETDENDLRELVEVFRELEVSCEGQLTRPALHQVAQRPHGNLAPLAAELLRRFDALDVDGSDNVDWSEIVASVIGAGLSNLLGRGAMPSFDDSFCLRSFDLLSQGTGKVSGASLAQLFLSVEADAWQVSPSGGTGGSFDHSGAGGTQRIAEYGRICREVDPRETVDRARFLAMMRGR